jgi:hypothetical protein
MQLIFNVLIPLDVSDVLLFSIRRTREVSDGVRMTESAMASHPLNQLCVFCEIWMLSLCREILGIALSGAIFSDGCR